MKLPPFLIVLAIAGIIAPVAVAGQQGVGMEWGQKTRPDPVVALKDSEISLEARIIAVADVFQALAQERPYRGPLEPQAILANLKQQVEARKLDDRVVALVEANLDECWRTALRQTQV